MPIPATIRSSITIVSGLPRSGTSLMMQMLQAGGLPALTDNLRTPDENNPCGYFEFEPVKRLRIDQSWLDQAQGHAVKIIHLLLRELPVDGRFAYRVILMKRPIEEILCSQRLMLTRQGKRAAPDDAVRQIYQSQLEQIEEWLRSQPVFSCFSVAYHDVLGEPRGWASNINEFLGDDLNVAAMANVVDANLWHQRVAKID